MSTPGRLALSAIDPVLDQNGNLSAGATLTFYQTGTTTPATFYTDSTLATPVANPQTSNAGGRFYSQTTAFWSDATYAYDILLQLTDGETYTYSAVDLVALPPNLSGFLQNPNVALTGVPTAPTPAANDASSKIATTQFVQSALSLLAIFPSGAIWPFGMSAMPSGWLACDGSSYLRTAYPALYSAIGTSFGSADSSHFNVPDMRGYFPRGFNAGSGVGPTTSIGTVLADQMQGHYHAPLGDTTFFEGNTGIYGVNGGVSWTTSTTTGSPVTDTVNGTPRTGTETRPQMLAMAWGIKT